METDKIQLLFTGDLRTDSSELTKTEDNEIIIEHPWLIQLSIKMDIENITKVEFSDVSSPDNSCNIEIPESPSTIASFTISPKANIKNIDFRIGLPCAAYRQKFYYLIKVESLNGNFFTKKKFPAKVIYTSSEM